MLSDHMQRFGTRALDNYATRRRRLKDSSQITSSGSSAPLHIYSCGRWDARKREHRRRGLNAMPRRIHFRVTEEP